MSFIFNKNGKIIHGNGERSFLDIKKLQKILQLIVK
jgi:hypothetical protein